MPLTALIAPCFAELAMLETRELSAPVDCGALVVRGTDELINDPDAMVSMQIIASFNPVCLIFLVMVFHLFLFLK